MTSEKETDNGFPVYVFLRASKMSAKKKVIGHCQLEYWNEDKKSILHTHPDYDFLMPELLNYKSLIAKINNLDLSYSEAVSLLFKDRLVFSSGFYDLAIEACKGTPSESINITALNSFNRVYPDILINEITKDHAENYMKVILKHQKPNGVHTYMRKLNALFGLVSSLDNPFKGVRPKKTRTPSKALFDDDLKKILYSRTIKSIFRPSEDIESLNRYRYYFMLMFYLGGIDLIDLSKLRYDKHVIGDRVKFQRAKGGTDVFVDNKIFECAYEILKRFDCYPYLVPIYESKNYRSFRNNFNKRFADRLSDLELSHKPLSKSARYTFINRAQQLLIDERITMEIVGHTRQGVHGIYTDEFPLSVRDAAHEKIINL